MNMTEHANLRCQQRAIPPLLIDLLLQFGTCESAGNGASKVFFDKAARKKVKSYAGTLSRMIEGHLDLYAVVAEGNKVITVGHRYERIRRN